MTPTVFVEGCAGQACLSLGFVAGRATPPAWARPGNKVGYFGVIARAAGLVGWKPERIVLAEPAADCRVMLGAYTRPDVLREAAGHLRRWGAEAGEEGQRALWARLRVEGDPDEGAADMGREVARVAAVQCRTVNQASVRGFGGRSDGDWKPARALKGDGWQRYAPDAPVRHLDVLAGLAWPPVELHRDVRAIDPIPGAVLYLDPTYEETHGYGSDNLTRADALNVARAWRAVGALVVVSEAAPLADMLGEGWHSIDIAEEHAHPHGSTRGGVNAFRSEWLTLSRPPARGWRMRGQMGLFGGGR